MTKVADIQQPPNVSHVFAPRTLASARLPEHGFGADILVASVTVATATVVVGVCGWLLLVVLVVLVVPVVPVVLVVMVVLYF